MARIKGISVTLVDKKEIGQDPFGAPIFEDAEIVVNNVLVVPSHTEDIINQLNLTGKKAEYILAIPKNDNNIWENKEVLFFGKKWKTIGIAQEGIESNIPLDWNKKIGVERYE